MFLFKKKDAEIKAHNANEQSTFTMGHNQFSCLTFEEFSSNYLGGLPPPEEEKAKTETEKQSSEGDSDTSSSDESVSVVATLSHPKVKIAQVDWRDSDGVSEVRNQGKCGSCWAFGTTGVIESARRIQLSIGGRLSEQQLVDCTFDRNGCDGGWTTSGLDYVIKHGGIQMNKHYRYRNEGKYKDCPKGNIGGPAKIANKTSSRNNDCTSLQQLVKVRPAAVSVCVTHSFQNYKGGVFNGCKNNCNTDHIVLLYGYTSKGNWRIKNSWGKSWGNRGHMRIKSGNMCSICKYGGVNAYATA